MGLVMSVVSLYLSFGAPWWTKRLLPPFLHSCVSRQRPTAKELLKHKFIVKHCKKTSYLSELIDRHRRWKEEGHSDSSSDDSDRWTMALHSQGTHPK